MFFILDEKMETWASLMIMIGLHIFI